MLPQLVVDELAASCRGTALNEPIWPAQTGRLGHAAVHAQQLVVWCREALPDGGRQCTDGRAEGCGPGRRGGRAPRPDAGHSRRGVDARVPCGHAARFAAYRGVRWRSLPANVKAVQRMLGHKSAAMTLDTYADLFDDDLAAVADRLQKNVGVLWGQDPNSDRPTTSDSL